MSDTKKPTTTKKATTKKKAEPKKERKPNSGQFKKGNEIGKETRFKKNHTMSCKYKPEYCDMLIDYFSQPSTRIEYKRTYFKGELSSETPIVIPNEYPTFEMFAAKIGVTRETLLNWCDEYPQFKHYYARAKEIQLGKLTSNAMIGLYNPLYAKFEATNNHGMAEQTKNDTTFRFVTDETIDEESN